MLLLSICELSRWNCSTLCWFDSRIRAMFCVFVCTSGYTNSRSFPATICINLIHSAYLSSWLDEGMVGLVCSLVYSVLFHVWSGANFGENWPESVRVNLRCWCGYSIQSIRTVQIQLAAVGYPLGNTRIRCQSISTKPSTHPSFSSTYQDGFVSSQFATHQSRLQVPLFSYSTDIGISSYITSYKLYA